MNNAFFKIISLLAFLAILWVGFTVYNFFYPIKFVESDKISTEFTEIGNPFRDDYHYYQVKKYLFSKKKWAIGFGGGASYSQDYYGYGLADADKKIIVAPKRYVHYNFYKTIGYNKKKQLDTINLIGIHSFKKSKKTTKYLNQNGTIFNVEDHFGENPVLLIEWTGRNSNFGCLFDLKSKICISRYYNIEWLNYNTLLVSKIDYTAKKNKIKYGAISNNGKLISPITKISKEEVLQELKLTK